MFKASVLTTKHLFDLNHNVKNWLIALPRSSSRHLSSGPASVYSTKVKSGLLKYDDYQENIAKHLQELFEQVSWNNFK